LSFCFCQRFEPTLLSLGRFGLVPMYFCTSAMFCTETWILAASAYSMVRYSPLPPCSAMVSTPRYLPIPYDA
jgi:hypothetical protein